MIGPDVRKGKEEIIFKPFQETIGVHIKQLALKDVMEPASFSIYSELKAFFTSNPSGKQGFDQNYEVRSFVKVMGLVVAI